MDRINQIMKRRVLLFTALIFTLCSANGNAQPNIPSKITFHLENTAGISPSVLENMKKNANAVFTEINMAKKGNRDLNLSGKGATSSAIDNISLIWKTNRFHCTSPRYNETVNKSWQGGYTVRNISVYSDAKNTQDDKNQDIVICFDTITGMISDIFIATERTQYKKITDIATDVKEFRHRQMALDFLEQFRTAYCRKDSNYIDKVFSSYALIITGYKIEYQEPETGRKIIKIENKEQNKKQYMTNLKKVFKANKSLDIKFPVETISIKQHVNNKNVYAIRCKQDWTAIKHNGSLGYSDSGWLTLVIDFTNEVEPQIWVRAWQDPSFTDKELLNLNNYNF